jgi:uncharacterized protein YbjT (DUF2867 family)
MARCLIIGCGCRGLSLAAELRSSGHSVRGTTRDPGRRTELEAAGVEAHVGDPDRVATLASAFDHAVVACLLLGSATGPRESLEALFTTRLDMLLEKMLDTTVRGVVYEESGSADPHLLATGSNRVAAACRRSLIPFVLLRAEPADHAGWLAAATGGVRQILG